MTDLYIEAKDRPGVFTVKGNNLFMRLVEKEQAKVE